MRKSLLVFVFAMQLFVGYGAKPFGKINFYSFFDNREYDSKYNTSQTFFGTRTTPELGMQIDREQKLVVGATIFYENGKGNHQDDPELSIYYQYETQKINASFGNFSREKMMGNFPSCFLSDSIKIYDPNMSGILLQSKCENGFAEFGIDWNGFRTNTQRESFLMLSAGKYNFNRFYVGCHLSYFHFARTWNAPDDQHLTDNGLIHLFSGVDLSCSKTKDSAYIQVGYLQGVERIRDVNDSRTPGGFFTEAYYKHKQIGVKNTLYVGDHQMTFYNQYGNKLYWGDSFFQSHVYNRTELFWNVAEKKNTVVRLSSIHHFDGAVFGWQQVMTLSVKI